jgi:3-methyladenine DNA glycosylase/8-oxoguanine DNA glycosylase
MGPFSEDRQYQRAESIKRLLDTNPQLDPVYKAMWQDKLKGLALNESTYNFRVKTIYSQMKKELWVK